MKIVIALGGNALGNNPEEQIQKAASAVKPLASLIKTGHQVTIAHGNGPQVGMINLAFETASLTDPKQPSMPFPECGAMSQGYIGYHLQTSLKKELSLGKMENPVVTLVTQVEVSKEDPAFSNPTKPIGSFYSKEDASELAKAKGYVMKEDANRGYRRVVPSPMPIDIVEIDSIKTLVNQGCVVITVGGGGIPVIRDKEGYQGVAAVIDKDFASAKLADLLDCDMLVILTAIDKVKINFGTKNELSLDNVSVVQLKKYIKEGHFHKGSMLPKVEAAIKFVEARQGRTAVIAFLDEAVEAVNGMAGTLIHN